MKTVTRSAIGVAVVLAAAGVMLSGSHAAAQSSSGGWQFTIAPYMWAAGMDGAITVKGVEANVDVPFSDIISDLDFAAMAHFDMLISGPQIGVAFTF